MGTGLYHSMADVQMTVSAVLALVGVTITDTFLWAKDRMHHTNNAVIMQTKQLGRIKTLEEKLHVSEGCVQELEHKLAEQDRIIANLVGDNLKHLQDNMCLTAHINSMSMRLAQIKEQLGQVGMLVYGIARGALEGPSMEGSLLEARMLDASGNNRGD